MSRKVEIDSAELPRASHSGEMDVAGIKVPCHVLEDGREIVSQRGVIGMLTGEAKTGALGRYVDGIPSKPGNFSMVQIAFRTRNGVTGIGYLATEVLVLIQIYANARNEDTLRKDQLHIGKRCASMLFAFAGRDFINALREATGYSADRVKREFELKCQLYLVSERKPYEPIISDEVRKELFRLYRLPYHPWKNPPFFQSLYRKYIHDAIDPEMARVIKQRNPNPRAGSAHTQWWSHEGMLRAQEQKFVTYSPAWPTGLGGGFSGRWSSLLGRSSPKAPSAPLQHSGGVDIPMDDETASVTSMYSHGQRLGNVSVTPTAFLRRAAWIHRNVFAPSFFRFGFEDRSELCPRNVVDLFGQHAAGETFNVEFFDRDGLVFLHQAPGNFVMEVPAGVPHVSVFAGENLRRLATALAAALTLRHSTLSTRQFELCLFQGTWILDPSSVGACGEGFDADIQTNVTCGEGQRLCGNVVAGQVGVPVAVGVQPNSDLLDASLVGAMEFDFDLTDARELQAFVAGTELGSVAASRIGEVEASVAVLPFEARISRLLAGFDAAKERLERAIEFTKDVLKKVEVDVCELWTKLANLSQVTSLVVVVPALARSFVGVSALLQCGVVQFAEQREDVEHRSRLRRRRIESVAESPLHIESVAAETVRSSRSRPLPVPAGTRKGFAESLITLMRASSSPADFRMRFRNDQKRTGIQLSFGERS